MKAIQSRLTAVRRTEGFGNRLFAFLLSIGLLFVYVLLLAELALKKLGHRVLRALLEPFCHDAPLVYRRGAWRFLPKSIVFGVFAVTNNDYYSGLKPMPQPADSSEVCIRVTAAIAGTGAINDVVKLCKLPADCVVTGWELDSDDLDSGTNLLAVDFGILNAAETAVSATAADGGKWLTASTALTAAPSYVDFWAGTAAEKRALLRMSPSSANRTIGLVVTTAGNAGAVAAALVGLSIWYRPAAYGG